MRVQGTMNESDLYRYALIVCLVGFLSLGAIVLFIPVPAPNDANMFIDGTIKEIYPADEGMVIIVQEQVEHSFFISSPMNLSKYELYRFYDVQYDVTKKDALLYVEHMRKIS